MLNFIEAFFISTFGARKDDERGASAVEYGLLIAGIAAVIVATVFFLGDFITGIFDDTCNKVAGGKGAAGTGGCDKTP
ncbi:Flp family type IVb pilin [Nocardioides massiliensis]|uniref:Pilus assembly protein Flp/PilA n=1 Tax=Nocardioides massiliensis TaxID=1325935 RepID=A0ABT9NT26_9ACTN|nr:Flp family type IVb pilin [Nocardioides massiliensis]MDP9823566.1 pilus assembly protein Flp/PilA [Nocardioides massiliensis]